MQYMRRNRVIGIMVVAFASLLVVPALLSHTDEDVSKLKVTSAKPQSLPVPVGVANTQSAPQSSQQASTTKRLPTVPLPSVAAPQATVKSGRGDSTKKADNITKMTKKPAFELASLDGEDAPQSVDTKKSIALPQPTAKKATANKQGDKQANNKVSKKTNHNAQKTSVTSAKKASPQSVKNNANAQPFRKGQTVQVASLANGDNAEKLQKNLQTNGIPAFIKQVIVDKKQYTRVMIGPFSNEKALTQAKAKLSKLGY